MTVAAPRPCNTYGCSRLPRDGWALCDQCADRLVAGALGRPQPIAPPEWLKRRNAVFAEQGLVADKDLTAAR